MSKGKGEKGMRRGLQGSREGQLKPYVGYLREFLCGGLGGREAGQEL
jgi:hypothetical protein